jgi:hypothetical protein
MRATHKRPEIHPRFRGTESIRRQELNQNAIVVCHKSNPVKNATKGEKRSRTRNNCRMNAKFATAGDYLPGSKRSRHSYGCTLFSGFHTK